MAAVIEGKPKVAVSGAEAHLEEYPRDALVLSLLLGAFGLYAFSGRPDHDAAKLAICERHASHYGEDWWFLSYLGWSHTEAGNPAHRPRADRTRVGDCGPPTPTPRMACRMRMFEQGDMEAGRTFLSPWLPAHDRQSFLHGHLCWHVALTALDAGDPDGALAIYEQQIKPAGSPLSAAEHLHRRRLAAVAAVARRPVRAGAALARCRRLWRAISSRRPARISPTSTTRWRLRQRAARRLRRTVGATGSARRRRQAGPGPAAIDLCRGVQAFAEGDHDGAIRILEPLMPELVRIGGSHAQRELWEDTLIVAYLRAGHGDKAARLIPDAGSTAGLPRATQAWSHAARATAAASLCHSRDLTASPSP